MLNVLLKKNDKPIEYDKSNFRNGIFKAIYGENGESYTGAWKNNKKHGFGCRVQKKEKISYQGFWKKDKRDGKGLLYRTNNLHEFIYNGMWKKDKKHPFSFVFLSLTQDDGIQYYDGGGRYEGGWKKNKRSGRGRMDYKDGSTYLGFWLDDGRSGFGKMWYADDSTYEGYWQNDKRHGYGILITGENNNYEGYWKNDLKHGEGRYYFYDKGVEHSGLWIKDIFCCGVYELKNPNPPTPMKNEIPVCTQRNIQDALDKEKECYKLKM
ncbi:hypothetical protein NPIL_221811 [Nephila pilipes]|uniref:MORN repeat-containing protein 3 n=1 Tax=Nephila pilipes TaxID=299642 RepID=A0A8X6TUX4_NEPPI|nr:hypothetical protein NPIL_221811 [Nephila pilipes]